MTTTCRATRPDQQQCGARTDGLICTLHLNQIRDALERLPELLQELDVTISRQDRGTAAPLYAMNRAKVQQPGVHYDEGDTTLPSTQWAFSWDAANVRWTIENTLTTWSRHVAEQRGIEISVRAKHTKTTPARTFVEIVRNRPRRVVHVAATSREYANPTYLADLARWLLDHLDHIRADEAAPELWDEIRACERDARRAIDRQEPDLFAGRCDAMTMTAHWVDDGDGETLMPELAECGTDLMARTGDDDVKCPQCGAVYDLAIQTRKMVALLPDIIAPTSDIANALTSLSEPVTPSMIRQMAHRKEIFARGVDIKTASMVYRVGDVMEVLERRAARKAAIAERRASKPRKMAG